MAEKKTGSNIKTNHNGKLPWKRHRVTLGQWAADKLAAGAGSWGFIIGFIVFLGVWIILNSVQVLFGIWDEYPFILLNLFLSCLAAIQAPVILMAQNRAAERDRLQVKKDYYIDRKAEKEIKILQIQVLELKEMISKQPLKQETERLVGFARQLR